MSHDTPVLGTAERVSRAGLIIAAVTCASVIVSHIFARTTYSVLLPAISDELVPSYSAAGFLGASYFAGYLLGVIGVTVVSSRIEPIALMRTGLGLSVLALGVLATAPRFSVFASGVFFAGMAGAGIWIPAPTVATSLIPARHRGLVMGALTATMGLGLLLLSQGTNLFRSVIDDEASWRPIFGIEVVLTLLILTASLVLVRVPPMAMGGERRPLFSFDSVRSIPDWKLLTIAYTSFAALAGAWTQFMGVAMRDDAGFSSVHVTNLYSVLAVAAIPGPLLLGRLSDRIGRDRAMMFAASLACGASLMLPLGSEPFVAIAVALYGAGSFGLPPIAAAAVRDHLEGGAFGTAFGTMTILYAIVSMLSSQFIGWLADATGSFTLGYLLLALLAGVSGSTAMLRAQRSAS